MKPKTVTIEKYNKLKDENRKLKNEIEILKIDKTRLERECDTIYDMLSESRELEIKYNAEIKKAKELNRKYENIISSYAEIKRSYKKAMDKYLDSLK